MELLIQIIFILTVLKFSLKAAIHDKYWIIALYALGAAVLAMALYPFVVEMPANAASQLLKDRNLVTDMAVIITAETLLEITIAIIMLKGEKSGKIVSVLKYIPGVIIFAAVAYFELMFFRWRVGADFMQSAILYSVLTFAAILILCAMLRFIAPNSEMRLELKMLFNFSIFAIAMLVNSMVAEYNLSNNQSVIEWKAMAAILIIGAIVIIIGFFTNEKIKQIFKRWIL
ncbi:MAG: hypothetical protein SNH13_03085 [Rikenellaceae bacterium]